VIRGGMPRILNRSFTLIGGLLVVGRVGCAGMIMLLVPSGVLEAATDIGNVTALAEVEVLNSPPSPRISSKFGFLVLRSGISIPRDNRSKFKDAPKSGGRFGFCDTVLWIGVLVIRAVLLVEITEAKPDVDASETDPFSALWLPKSPEEVDAAGPTDVCDVIKETSVDRGCSRPKMGDPRMSTPRSIVFFAEVVGTAPANPRLSN
jgi:hypothetical protein